MSLPTSNNPKPRENSSRHGGYRKGSGRKRKLPEQSTQIDEPVSNPAATAFGTGTNTSRGTASRQIGPANFWSTRAPQGPTALRDIENPWDPNSATSNALPSLTSDFESMWTELDILQSESGDIPSVTERVFDEGVEDEPEDCQGNPRPDPHSEPFRPLRSFRSLSRSPAYRNRYRKPARDPPGGPPMAPRM
ncbi:hypothetical protein B0H19DRAFT_1266183 [Mycena capillaripes]|nr:hypothetical protein B0H19DRAFT_1266183 [Mycena capillaripes]